MRISENHVIGGNAAISAMSLALLTLAPTEALASGICCHPPGQPQIDGCYTWVGVGEGEEGGNYACIPETQSNPLNSSQICTVHYDEEAMELDCRYPVT